MKARRPLFVVVLGTVGVAIAFRIAGPLGAGPSPASRLDIAPRLILPLVVRHGAPAEPPTATAIPTSGPATPTTLPEPPGEHGAVVFQIATYGGLSMDLILGYAPTETPWFTLYEDGAYVRVHRDYGDERHTVSVFVGQMDGQQMAALRARLVDEAEFFDLPANPPGMVCATDGPNDYLYLRDGGREHRISVYGLSFFTPGRTYCPTPWAPDPRLVTLARIVDDLGKLRLDERALIVDRGTLVAAHRDDFGEAVAPWPVSFVRLGDLEGDQWRGSRLFEGDQAREVMAAVAVHSDRGPLLAAFTEDARFYLVGFRIEFPGWDTYK